jgi:hypothetical protein
MQQQQQSMHAISPGPPPSPPRRLPRHPQAPQWRQGSARRGRPWLGARLHGGRMESMRIHIVNPWNLEDLVEAEVSLAGPPMAGCAPAWGRMESMWIHGTLRPGRDLDDLVEALIIWCPCGSSESGWPCIRRNRRAAVVGPLARALGCRSLRRSSGGQQCFYV